MAEPERLSYLFLPDHVRNRLESFPALKGALRDPEKEGAPSQAFPNARKSGRQIYRVLANDHFPHLLELLERIDHCMSQGFLLPTLTRTSGGSNFESGLAELRTAEQLLEAGWTLEELEITRDQESVPEFLVFKNGHTAVVEVYCPRTREGLDQFMDRLMHEAKDLDRALDFRFEVEVEQLNRFDEQGHLLHVNPQELARGLDQSTRQRLEKALTSEIRDQLDAGQTDCRAEVDDATLNIKASLQLSDVARSQSDLPARRGSISPPGFSGYAPEAIFDRLVSGGIRRKALKRQGPGSEAASDSILVVDMSCSDLADYLDQPAYIEDFKKSLLDHLGGNRGGYDALLFCDRAEGPGLRGQLLVSDTEPSPMVAQIATDFGLSI